MSRAHLRLASTEPTGLLPKPRSAVYDLLKRRIVLNDLRPGHPLTELGLARELRCSQGTIREALLLLQEDGLVVRSGHRGTAVTGFGPDEAGEILALRRRIETRGALRAALAARDDALMEERALLDAMREAASGADEYRLIELDTAFHLAIFRRAGLRALEQILVRCILHTHRSKLWAPGHRRSLMETAERHRPLLERLEARDGPGLAAALDHHLDTIVEAREPLDALG